MLRPEQVAIAAFILLGLVSAGSPALADDTTIAPAPPGPSCEWNPHEELRPDAGNCGFNDASFPNQASYECGKAQDCRDLCLFKRCNGP